MNTAEQLTIELDGLYKRLSELEEVDKEKREAEKALRKYTSELESSNEELDAFAHTVAHDLKNPLNVVLGATQQLSQDLKEMTFQEIKEMLQIISWSAVKMTSIVNELLLLASVRKMDEITLSKLNMKSIISNVKHRLSNEISASQTVIYEPNDWLSCSSYPPWIEEVWSNYISNAIKYGGNPPLISIGSKDLNGSIKYWVSDNGSGLTKEQISTLFTSFTRHHKMRAQGDGLGLSIVKRIIEKLGGEVGVESQPGNGSIFYFTLPKIKN